MLNFEKYLISFIEFNFKLIFKFLEINLYYFLRIHSSSINFSLMPLFLNINKNKKKLI